MGLPGPKLVLTCDIKKALGVDLYAPCRHLIELTVGVPLLACGGKGFYEQKLLKYRTLVAVSSIWAQLPSAQAADGVWVHGLQRDVSSGLYFFLVA
jgi:hypothetical protein